MRRRRRVVWLLHALRRPTRNLHCAAAVRHHLRGGSPGQRNAGDYLCATSSYAKCAKYVSVFATKFSQLFFVYDRISWDMMPMPDNTQDAFKPNKSIAHLIKAFIEFIGYRFGHQILLVCCSSGFYIEAQTYYGFNGFPRYAFKWIQLKCNTLKAICKGDNSQNLIFHWQFSTTVTNDPGQNIIDFICC